MAIATAATAIKSQARLNWNRGSGNQRRDDRVGDVFGSGMFQFDCRRVSSVKAVESYHSA